MDNNHPHYPICIQVHESPEECKKMDAAVLTAIASHTHFEEMNGELESDDDNSSDSNDYVNIYGGCAYIWLIPPPKNWQYFALPKCLLLTICFNTEGQRWDKIPYQFSRTMQWVIAKQI